MEPYYNDRSILGRSFLSRLTFICLSVRDTLKYGCMTHLPLNTELGVPLSRKHNNKFSVEGRPSMAFFYFGSWIGLSKQHHGYKI